MSEEKRKKLREIRITVISPARQDDEVLLEWITELVRRLSADTSIDIHVCPERED